MARVALPVLKIRYIHKYITDITDITDITEQGDVAYRAGVKIMGLVFAATVGWLSCAGPGMFL
jgi:hypothetical protein